ncbi:hypothetical protein ACF09C_10180 [Streptomyces sp. NPDC014870]|uniref:hypothetical protein n=1 Tax=Streptomyces sp. NPDC014870 TaxID=3364925 RepID=UPI0036F703BD
MEIFDVAGDDEPAAPRPGPWWKHLLSVVTATACGLALGWVAAAVPWGPADYGIPAAAPGSPWGLLAACGAAGLIVAGLLRGAAARFPVYAPGRIGFVLVFLGTRLALGFRPEPAELAAGAGLALLAAAIWCAHALHLHRRATAA